MSATTQRCRAALIALALDALLPELPNAIHPVVLIGRWFILGERIAPQAERARLIWGAAWLAGGLDLGAGVAARVPRSALAEGLIAQTLLAYRGLDRTVGQVQAALAANDLIEARRLLSWHLVSRPTADLTAEQVAAAAIESLGENLSDSVIAPLCWYLVGGLPALVAYRVSNTADAMWGYRNARYEQLGKAAARLDDVLNLVPSRLTAVLLVSATQIVNGRGGAAWRVAWRDHRRTASPNAGWPMAALAGALETSLTKVDHYTLGDGMRAADPDLIDEGRRIARGVWLIVIVLLVSGSTVRHVQK